MIQFSQIKLIAVSAGSVGRVGFNYRAVSQFNIPPFIVSENANASDLFGLFGIDRFHFLMRLNLCKIALRRFFFFGVRSLFRLYKVFTEKRVHLLPVIGLRSRGDALSLGRCQSLSDHQINVVS